MDSSVDMEGPERDRLVAESVLLALFLVSAAANSLALLVFCRRPGLRTISNRFVINLLAGNVVTTSLLAPALLAEHAAGGVGLGAWRGAGEAAAAGCSLAALLGVTLIALDQHHAVTDPLRCHARLLQRRPGPLCAAAGAAAAAVAALRAALAAAASLLPPSPLLAALQLAYAGVFLLGVLAPVGIVCAVYARIYGAARRAGRRARASGASALQLHEPQPPPDEEGLTLRIDVPGGEEPRYGPFLLPPERPRRCPSVASLRHARKDDPRPALPAVSSAPLLAAPLLLRPPSSGTSRITSIRCRISNASMFRYREESRAARVGLLTGALVLLHVPHAVLGVLQAAGGAGEAARLPALALLLLGAAASPFLFALRSRRVQREARRLLLPEKSAWERGAAAAAAAADGQRARAALDLLRTLSPGEGEAGEPGTGAGVAAPGNEAAGGAGAAGRGSFSSGGSTQLSSASDE